MTQNPDGEAATLELSRMWSISLFPLLPGPLWPGVVATGGSYVLVKSKFCIKIVRKQMTYAKLNCLK